MIPTTEVTGSILDALIVYVAILGILLLVATWLRLKIPILKKYHIPAALIAGVIGPVSYTHLAYFPGQGQLLSGAGHYEGVRGLEARLLCGDVYKRQGWTAANFQAFWTVPSATCGFPHLEGQGSSGLALHGQKLVLRQM